MGVEVVSPHYGSVGAFSGSLAAVTVSSALWPMVGYIDRSGRLAIPAQFQSDCPFSEGRARVEKKRRKSLFRVESEWGYIDSGGAYVVTPRFRFARDFSEGLAAVQVERDGRELWGYVDRDGGWAIEPRFVAAEDFSEGRAAVRRSGESWSYVDHAGAEVLVLAQGRPRSYGFREGRAAVKVGARAGYIDPTGAAMAATSATCAPSTWRASWRWTTSAATSAWNGASCPMPVVPSAVVSRTSPSRPRTNVSTRTTGTANARSPCDGPAPGGRQGAASSAAGATDVVGAPATPERQRAARRKATMSAAAPPNAAPRPAAS